MNKKKLIVIVVMLFALVGGASVLYAAGVINIPGLIQTGDYFNQDNMHYIKIDNLKGNKGAYLQSVEIEDYYSNVVSNIYKQNAEIYTTGKIDFVRNNDEDGNFEVAYIVQGSDKVKNYDEDVASTNNGFEENEEGLQFTNEDIVVDQYEDEESFNNAISSMVGQNITFDELQRYEN